MIAKRRLGSRHRAHQDLAAQLHGPRHRGLGVGNGEVEIPRRVAARRHGHQPAVLDLAVGDRPVLALGAGDARRRPSRTARGRRWPTPRRPAWSRSFQASAPGTLTTPAPACRAGCQRLMIAPWGSRTTARRPESPTSPAGSTTGRAQRLCARRGRIGVLDADVAVPVRRHRRIGPRPDRGHRLSRRAGPGSRPGPGPRRGVLVVPAEQAGVERLRGFRVLDGQVDPAERPRRVARALGHALALVDHEQIAAVDREGAGREAERDNSVKPAAITGWSARR